MGNSAYHYGTADAASSAAPAVCCCRPCGGTTRCSMSRCIARLLQLLSKGGAALARACCRPCSGCCLLATGVIFVAQQHAIAASKHGSIPLAVTAAMLALYSLPKLRAVALVVLVGGAACPAAAAAALLVDDVQAPAPLRSLHCEVARC